MEILSDILVTLIELLFDALVEFLGENAVSGINSDAINDSSIWTASPNNAVGVGGDYMHSERDALQSKCRTGLFHGDHRQTIFG